MAYKTLLAHVADPNRNGKLLAAAIPLARSMDAHLIGLSVLPPFVVMPGSEGSGASVTIDDHRTAYAADMAGLKESFAGATQGQTFQSEWREADPVFDSVSKVLLDQGRSADLIIAMQQDPKWSYSHLIEDNVRIAMQAGRPVLLVPNEGQIELPAKRITVAWNGKREAVRAVYDALPMLQAANAVNVLWINPEKDTSHAGDLPGDDICMALARHGVKCEASRASAIGADVGPELLRQSAAFGSNLLVMGCYGHSRLRELILGGASRHVLSAMNLPVLLSH